MGPVRQNVRNLLFSFTCRK